LLSEQQKEKSITKDKLIGMKVIDADGNLIGTVKDVGFTVGKPGISLSVENKEGEIQDVSWESIQGAADFIILKTTIPAMPASTQVPAQPTEPTQQVQSTCPTCKGPLKFIQQYQRWYCYKCQKYV
jgi:sporulation protein YlmC with PRC-barrel domain